MPEQPRLNGRGAPQPRWQESQHYDACGRLTERVLTHSPRRRLTEQQAQPQRTRFEWDALDRLTKVTLADGTQWQYRYDPFGRRISKTRLTPQTEAERMRYKNQYQNTQRSTFEATTHMEYRRDGDLLAGERRYLADGTLTREVQWIYEPGTFRPLAQAEQTGDTLRLLHIISDQAGTPKEICTEDGRIVVENREGIWQPYLSRNNILSRQELDWYAHNDKRSDSICCDLRHPGQMYDEETGLHYNRHRYYNPETGQYLSSDPIGLAGGLNLYGYVHNPLEWIDPLGLLIMDESKAKWISGVPVFGTAQQTGPGHRDAINSVAEEAAKSGRYKAIFLDRSWNTASHTMTGSYQDISRRRPDLILVDKSGNMYSIEVASRTDSPNILRDRNTTVSLNKGYGVVQYGHYTETGIILDKSNYSNLISNRSKKAC